MASSSEVVTLQVGNYSNYVGTHYWNFQNRLCSKEDSKLNESKLFREQTTNGLLVPRLILFEKKTNLSTLKEDGEFSETQNGDNVCNDIDYSLIEQDLIKKNEFIQALFQNNTLPDINMNKIVRSWTDFLTFQLNPNSMQLLSNQFSEEFHYYGFGTEEYSKLADDFDDKIHYWVEECNSMEGFQIFLDMHDGFSGLGCSSLEDLRDEYEKKNIHGFLNWPPSLSANMKHPYQLLNIALSFQSLIKTTNMFSFQSLKDSLFDESQVVKKIDGFKYEGDLPYHTSAILASAVHSITIPWREKSRKCSMADFSNFVTQDKWQLVSSSIGFPFFEQQGASDSLLDVFMERKTFSFMKNLFPYNKKIDAPYAKIYVLQCSQHNRVQPTPFPSSLFRELGVNCNVFNNDPLSVLDHFTNRYFPSEDTISKCFVHRKENDYTVPFPDILSNQHDTVSMTELFTSKKFYGFICEIVDALRKLNFNKLSKVQEMGLDFDTKQELLEDLINFAKQYDEQKCFEHFSNIT